MAHIVVLATGGTIAGRASCAADSVEYTAAQLPVEALLAAVPQLSPLLHGHSLRHEQVAQVDSKDMDVAVWQRLLARCLHALRHDGADAIVITHGTDTLEETAWFLHAMLQQAAQAQWLTAAQAQRPVILTCAMRPATARMPDGPQNLADALLVATNPHSRGVLAVAAGAVHSAAHVFKADPYKLQAFSSADAGPLAWVEDNRVRWLTPPQAPGAHPSHAAPPLAHSPQAAQASALLHAVLHHSADAWPWVEVLHSHAAARPAAVQALVQAGVDGLVLAGTGNATLHHALEAAALRAMHAGVRVVRSSRCLNGAIVHGAASAIPLAMAHAHALPPAKARIQLMLEILMQQGAAQQPSNAK